MSKHKPPETADEQRREALMAIENAVVALRLALTHKQHMTDKLRYAIETALGALTNTDHADIL